MDAVEQFMNTTITVEHLPMLRELRDTREFVEELHERKLADDEWEAIRARLENMIRAIAESAAVLVDTSEHMQ